MQYDHDRGYQRQEYRGIGVRDRKIGCRAYDGDAVKCICDRREERGVGRIIGGIFDGAENGKSRHGRSRIDRCGYGSRENACVIA